jgi:hypothetical protein
MLAQFLVPETTVREAGEGPELNVSGPAGRLILLTLGITRIIEQQSLDISIWGSADGADWGSKPLVMFPQKFYCGTYQVRLDLSAHPEVTRIKARWQVRRWGRGDPKPLFGFYVFGEETESHAVGAGV